MTKRYGIFYDFMHNPARGSMLVELLLSVALAALVIPFIFQYHQNAAVRTQNIAITQNMNAVQNVLERYIVENRTDLLRTVGKNITRVNIADLTEYGLSPTLVQDADKYQLRILKSTDTTGSATLQGVVVYTSSDITPIRTREIVNIGGANMGFVDGTRAYGAYGAWRNDISDIGIDARDGVVGTTSVKRDAALYLSRLPSDNIDDATMMSPFNLGGHDIINARFFDASTIQFAEDLNIKSGVVRDLIFQNRTAIDTTYTSETATVSGGLSSDGRTMEISGKFLLADVGKFSSFTVGDLWTSTMTLSGLSISAYDEYYREQPAILKIAGSLDMTAGRIESLYTTVGFAGSITPRLVVYDRIEDSKNSDYYWDVDKSSANFADVTLAELNRLATLAAHFEKVPGTDSATLFGGVTANKNATAADFMNAIREIQTRVRAKYRLLNL